MSKKKIVGRTAQLAATPGLGIAGTMTATVAATFVACNKKLLTNKIFRYALSV
jgi:hypothetical protein